MANWSNLAPFSFYTVTNPFKSVLTHKTIIFKMQTGNYVYIAKINEVDITVFSLLSPPGGLFISSTLEGGA